MKNCKQIFTKTANLVAKSYKVPGHKVMKVQSEIRGMLQSAFNGSQVDFGDLEKQIDYKQKFYSIAYPQAKVVKSIGKPTPKHTYHLEDNINTVYDKLIPEDINERGKDVQAKAFFGFLQEFLDPKFSKKNYSSNLQR